jgi:hypothetical protein
MCALLPPEQLDGLCSVFKRVFVIGQCPVNMNIPVLKNRGSSEGSQNKMAIFLKIALMILIIFQ